MHKEAKADQSVRKGIRIVITLLPSAVSHKLRGSLQVTHPQRPDYNHSTKPPQSPKDQPKTPVRAPASSPSAPWAVRRGPPGSSRSGRAGSACAACRSGSGSGVAGIAGRGTGIAGCWPVMRDGRCRCWGASGGHFGRSRVGGRPGCLAGDWSGWRGGSWGRERG